MCQIVYKRHEYKIILFPAIRDIRLYNAHPCETTYDVDGSVDSMREFAKCFAIAIADPQAIIYIPMKQNGVSDFNMILTRHSIDKFRPSIWYKIKHNLRKTKKSRKYVLSYDS